MVLYEMGLQSKMKKDLERGSHCLREHTIPAFSLPETGKLQRSSPHPVVQPIN